MKKAYYSHDQQRSKQNIEGLIEQVIADAEPTIICNDKGQKTVLLSIDEYNSWQETMYLLYSDQNTCLTIQHSWYTFCLKCVHSKAGLK